MKGLKIDSRVEGKAKKISGWDGTIVEVIQDERKKKFKVRWSNGQEIVHPSEALKVWGSPVVVRGPYLQRAAPVAEPVVAPVEEARWEYDSEVDGGGSVDSRSYSNNGSRCSLILAIFRILVDTAFFRFHL